MKFKTIFFGILSLSLFIGACQKEGLQGPAGEDGIDGKDGINGKDGNANVIYSDWFRISRTSRDTTIDASLYKIKDTPIPELTSAMIDTSAVLVYMKFSDAVHPLPYTSYAGSKINTLDYFLMPQRLFISRFTHDNSGSIDIGSTIDFRYIIISGNPIATKRGAQENKESLYKNMTYSEVCRSLNIPE